MHMVTYMLNYPFYLFYLFFCYCKDLFGSGNKALLLAAITLVVSAIGIWITNIVFDSA